MTAHVLDRPVWTALTTRQAAFAIGGPRACRFPPDIAPFAATRDDDGESLADLAALAGDHGQLLLLQVDPIAIPDELETTLSTMGVQMVASDLPAVTADNRIEPLGDVHVPAMVALARLTRPGPFARRTPALGAFLGVLEDGRLLAMAGERMKQPGFTEVSGVCTHPDARGRGLARALSLAVAARIVARGETPYLHAFASNAAAIALYESIGFRPRRTVHVAGVRGRNAARRSRPRKSDSVPC